MSDLHSLPFPGRAARFAAALSMAALLLACSSTSVDNTANMSVEKIHAEAKDEAANGGWERAAKLYEKLEGRAAGTMLAQQAQLDLAYVYYRSNERAQSLATIERFLKLHPTSPAADYALYLKGLVNFNENLGLFGGLTKQDLSERDQQAARDSYQAFRQLVDRYPESTYAPDATLRMNYIVNSLANYEVHVARYYYRRGAYVAAANRAQKAVQEFQQSPATEEALYIMARSYDRLGLAQLRDDAERVLRLNYPQSGYIEGGFQARDKPWWRLW